MMINQMKHMVLLIISGTLFFISSCKKDIGDPVIIKVTDTLSFQNDIQPIFSYNCSKTGCHVADHITKLDLTPDTSYALLVNIEALTHKPALRVKPFSADSSVLWNKVANELYLPCMPLGPCNFPQIDIDRIKKWIDQGALEN